MADRGQEIRETRRAAGQCALCGQPSESYGCHACRSNLTQHREAGELRPAERPGCPWFIDGIPERDALAESARMIEEHEIILDGEPIDDADAPRPTGPLLVCDADPREQFTPEQVATLMELPVAAVMGALDRDGMIEGLRFRRYVREKRKYRTKAIAAREIRAAATSPMPC